VIAYVIRRLGLYLLTFWAALTLNFLLPRLMPGSPTDTVIAKMQGRGLSPAAVKQLETALGVSHASLVTQYRDYLVNLAHFKFGVSVNFYPVAVSYLIRQALPWTLVLVGVTTIVGFVLGTLIGLVGAWRRGGFLDGALPPIFIITSAFPYFWLAILSIWLFSLKLGWLPQSGGYDVIDTPSWTWHFAHDAFVHSILPALTILVTAICGWLLPMRNNTISVLTEDYVRMARAKGLRPWRIMWTYAGRNAILPNLTGFAMSLGFVVAGAILVEFVFNYPGVGWMFLQSVENQDYALMQALFLMITVAVLLAILVADGATAVLDPRTRDQS
jgi:peptide/nickel transport system permease protein